ncbi:MAG: cation:proton antiporter [Candidatus Eremiobacterales bacterium]
MNGPSDWITVSLLVAVAIAAATVAAWLLRIPYTVALVLAGLLIGVLHGPSGIPFTPDIVMYVFLPPLLFAAAWEMDLARLRRWWVPIALLATIGVGIGVAIAYAVLRFGGHVDPAVAVAFGALVAATDPVAVIALFRELRIDRDLSTIVEGESLFNDGVAVVLVRALVAGGAGGAATASSSAGSFDLAATFGSMVALTAGGTAVGVVIGFGVTALLRLTKVPLVEAAITILAAFGSYAAGEAVHASGIFAVIAAGLTCSVVRSRHVPDDVATETVDRFWETAAIVANSVLFVLVGLAIDLPALVAAGPASAWGIGGVLAARAAIAYGLMQVAAFAGARTPAAWRHVVALGGLRGALAMALVLGLPENFHDRGLLVAMVFSVVLFTLVIQGLALRPAMRSLGLSGGGRSAAEPSG